jgi:hypothetical protein
LSMEPKDREFMRQLLLRHGMMDRLDGRGA